MSQHKGNALFLILVAVALFAALSYAVTQSGRGSGTTSREKTTLMAGQILQEAARLQLAVDRMIIRGSSARNLFFYTFSPLAYCETGDDCVFSPEGGGFDANSIYVPQEAIDPVDLGAGSGTLLGYIFASNDTTSPRGYSGVGDDKIADASIQFYPIRIEVCNEIDRQLGLGGVAPTGAAPWASNPAGTTPPGMTLIDIKSMFSVSVAPLDFCYKSAGGYGIYYHILAAD